jgi:hypothetical protein
VPRTAESALKGGQVAWEFNMTMRGYSRREVDELLRGYAPRDVDAALTVILQDLER